MKLRLITGWRNAWRLSSVQAAALLSLVSVLTVLHEQMLPLFAFAIPARYWPWVTGIWGAVIIVLRLVAQPGVLPLPDGAPGAGET